jgi:thymidine phosphorylase
MLLGAGRETADDAIDPSVGIVLHVKSGEPVAAREALAEIHYREESALGRALSLLREAYQIGECAPQPRSLVLQELGSELAS